MPTKRELEKEIDELELKKGALRRIVNKYINKLEDKECSVCKEEFTTHHRRTFDEDLYLLACNHHFHFRCIKTWVQSVNSVEEGDCPLCRKKLNNIEFFDLNFIE